MTPRPRAALLALVAAYALLAAACGGNAPAGDGDATAADDGATAAGAPDPSDWESVLAAAEGQTVDWYMFGGDDRLNAYITGYVADAAAELGVTLNQVPVGDTVEAVNKVLGEVQAGRTEDGTVDLIWINGENFLTGVQADLWHCGWSEEVPNAEFVDYDDPAIANDFGVPIDGCESAWNSAQSSITYDSEALDAADVETVDAFVAWIEANPGRFTYPAPPDFTGSMVMRTFLYHVNGGYENLLGQFDQVTYDEVAPELWEFLNGIEGSLWRGGETYPQTGADVIDLYANGEIDAFITYGGGDVPGNVTDGIFPESTRQGAFATGMISNTNYVTIPANSPDKAGAMVVANVLLEPEAQLEKAKAEVYGAPPAIVVDRTDLAAEFAALDAGESALPQELRDRTAPEIGGEWLTAFEEGWATNVLQQ